MKLRASHRLLLAALALVPAWLPLSAAACATCFGQTDSPMAKGMNAGIFLLLGIIGTVLVGVAAFFLYLVKRSAAHPGPAVSTEISQTPKQFST